MAVTVIGGFLSAGGAGAFNHCYDRDIDAAMAPHGQPPGAGRSDLAARGAALRVRPADRQSFVILAVGANLLSAFLALAGFVWYTVVYTIWLKRRSPQNIVIGGAAGAVPPLVGWAAVTGSSPPPRCTCSRSSSTGRRRTSGRSSLLMKEEYARVGVPMMPVVHGEVETRRQIVLYTLLLTVLTLLPFVFGFFGVIYAVFAAGLGAAFITLALRLQRARRPQERAAHLPVLPRLPRDAVRRDGGWTPSS